MRNLILLLIMSCSTFAVEENNFHLIYDVFRSQEMYELKTYTGRKGLKIDYMKYGQKVGSRGSVVIAVGRNEASIKYLEVAYDLYAKGFSPIYVTSHRGQGFSDRRLSNPNKGYVRHFGYYISDLKQLVNIVQSEIPSSTPLYLIGHSMGGAIGLAFIEKYPHVFKKAVFTSPMFKIKLDNSERSTLWDTFLACYIPNKPYCTDYVPDGSDPNPNPDFEDSDVTSSRTRFNWRQYLFNLHPRTMIGSSTIRWVRESILANLTMRKPYYVSKIETPFLILQAENELVVDNSGQNEVCELTDLCQLRVIHGSLHNILMEQDLYRDEAFKAIDRFLDNSAVPLN